MSIAASYQEIGEFRDHHDAAEHGEDEAVEFFVCIAAERYSIPVDDKLRSRIKALAQKRGVSEESLCNLLLKERIDQVEAVR